MLVSVARGDTPRMSGLHLVLTSPARLGFLFLSTETNSDSMPREWTSRPFGPKIRRATTEVRNFRGRVYDFCPLPESCRISRACFVSLVPAAVRLEEDALASATSGDYGMAREAQGPWFWVTNPANANSRTRLQHHWRSRSGSHVSLFWKGCW